MISDEDMYSGASSDSSLVDSRERAEAIVLARVNGHAPPLPPRHSPNKVSTISMLSVTGVFFISYVLSDICLAVRSQGHCYYFLVSTGIGLLVN